MLRSAFDPFYPLNAGVNFDFFSLTKGQNEFEFKFNQDLGRAHRSTILEGININFISPRTNPSPLAFRGYKNSKAYIYSERMCHGFLSYIIVHCLESSVLF